MNCHNAVSYPLKFGFAFCVILVFILTSNGHVKRHSVLPILEFIQCSFMVIFLATPRVNPNLGGSFKSHFIF